MEYREVVATEKTKIDSRRKKDYEGNFFNYDGFI